MIVNKEKSAVIHLKLEPPPSFSSSLLHLEDPESSHTDACEHTLAY